MKKRPVLSGLLICNHFGKLILHPVRTQLFNQFLIHCLSLFRHFQSGVDLKQNGHRISIVWLNFKCIFKIFCCLFVILISFFGFFIGFRSCLRFFSLFSFFLFFLVLLSQLVQESKVMIVLMDQVTGKNLNITSLLPIQNFIKDLQNI